MQKTLQQLLQCVAGLQSAIGAAEESTTGPPLNAQELERDLRRYAAYLAELEEKARRVAPRGPRGVAVPLDAVRHLDTGDVALGPWCQALSQRVRAARRVAPAPRGGTGLPAATGAAGEAPEGLLSMGCGRVCGHRARYRFLDRSGSAPCL